MTAYYNEFDPYCAQWLRNLIDAGHIPFGDVDERSITEIDPDEIKEYDQWHFFAGLGGWGYAARLAGIGETSGVLTGSPPCQPFSSAGKRQGYADERHLAPVWLDLVAALRPAWVFGEQVAAAINKDNWLDDLLNELEKQGYATGAIVLPACGVGAPHIRQRLWVTARLSDSNDSQCKGTRLPSRVESQNARPWDSGALIGLADAADNGHLAAENRGSIREKQKEGRVQQSERACSHGGMADTKSTRAGENQQGLWKEHGNGCKNGRLADTDALRQPRKRGGSATQSQRASEREQAGGMADATDNGHLAADGLRETVESPKPEGAERFGQSARGSNHRTSSEAHTGWDDPDWLYCRDGKWRAVESGTFPLADGIPARVGRLRGYGNAIVPQVATEIIKEVM